MVAAMLFITSGFVRAERGEVWIRDYKVTVELGENTTRGVARQEAMDKARSLASNEFGAVILTEEELRDSALSQRTKVISAGLASLKVKSERVVQGHDSSIKIEYEIEATLNENELERQLEALRSNVLRDQKLKLMSRENEILQERLAAARASTSAAEQEKTVSADLLRGLQRTAPRIVDGSTSFPQGALVRAGLRNDRSKVVLEQLERTFFDPFINTDLNFSIRTVELISGRVDVEFQTSWQLDMSKMRASSLDFATTYHQLPNGGYNDGMCADVRGMAADIKESLFKEFVLLEVEVAGEVFRYAMAGKTEMYDWYCIANGKPFRIGKFSLARGTAEQAGSIKTRVVRSSTLQGDWMKGVRMDLMKK
jgi:hypothetical protein